MSIQLIKSDILNIEGMDFKSKLKGYISSMIKEYYDLCMIKPSHNASEVYNTEEYEQKIMEWGRKFQIEFCNKFSVSPSLQVKNGYYYAVLNFKDQKEKRKQKCDSIIGKRK